MEFVKKVLVLKQVAEGFSVNGREINGILRAEKENGLTTFYLSVLNICSATGEFSLILIDGENKLYSYPIGNRPLSFRVSAENFVFNGGFSCGIVFIADDLPTVVAFSSEADGNLSAFKKNVTEMCINIHKERLKTAKENKPVETIKTQPETETPYPSHSPYDDEAVATVNYYEKEQSFIHNLAESLSDERSGNEKRERTSDFEDGKKETEKRDATYENANGDTTGEKPYYAKVKDELDGLFSSFPEDSTLNAIVPDSKWIKIHYAKEKYYVVGVVYENDTEKYICYGVPAKYSPEPPKELKGFCSFVPVSVFNLKGDGFWMMFQDAFTGECVKMDE